jgi:hypothetical protein
MLAQYDARHNQQQASVQLMAGTRRTDDKPKQAVLFTCNYAVLTQTVSFLETYRHIIRTSQRLSFGKPELKQTKSEKLTLCLENVRIYTEMVHKMCSADPKGSNTGSQEIRCYISLTVALKFNVRLKITAEHL